jgi:hypothetical protein
MSENKSRFVILCQQLLACGTVAALAAPATGVVSLEIVGPAPHEETAATADAAHVPSEAEVAVSVRRLTNGEWSAWEPVADHDPGEAPAASW